MSRTIAVTAASGQLGAAIVGACKALVGSENVIALARTPGNAQGLGVEVRAGDYANPVTLQTSLDGIDAVLLVSGNDAPEKRIGQHRTVIAAAQAAGVSRIVYTSVQGAEEDSAFSPVIQSNRQTEDDVRNSGLEWVVGRNGIYVEPDIEYLETYKKNGEVANCAGDGRCGYTTRPELAYAYARMLTDAKHQGHTYNLHGDTLTQTQLVEYLNRAYGTQLVYRAMSVEEFRAERIAELGEFIGTIIAGIYQGIRDGALDNPSDFSAAAGRAHQSWDDYFKGLT